MGGMEQQGGGRKRGAQGETNPSPLKAFPPLGVKDTWSKGANTMQKFGVDGKIMNFT